MATLFVDKVDPQSGTSLEIGTSGDTVTVPSGATFNVAGTLQSGGVAVANTPYFSAVIAGTQTISDSTTTILAFDSEQSDSAGAYDTSTYKFTPQVAGKYYFYAHWRTQSNGTWSRNVIFLYKNTTAVSQFNGRQEDENSSGASAFIDLNGSTDYVTARVYQNSGGTQQPPTGDGKAIFFGYRVAP